MDILIVYYIYSKMENLYFHTISDGSSDEEKVYGQEERKLLRIKSNPLGLSEQM